MTTAVMTLLRGMAIWTKMERKNEYSYKDRVVECLSVSSLFRTYFLLLTISASAYYNAVNTREPGIF